MTESMCTKSRIGIFGGSFDPVHTGHLVVAIRAIEQLELERLYVIPAYMPPHKVSSTTSPFETRMRWLKIVFDGIDEAYVSDYERERGGISYSLFTVRHFSKLHSCRPFLIVGEDSFVSLDTWFEYETLLDEATIAVYPRNITERDHSFDEQVIWLDAPRFDISSTEIRKRIKEGKSVVGLVPDSILCEVESFYG
ncbi:MAG TPA: nicotinate (nicotinamide) nucleotide adenylyltransferase [Mesotoga infera]|uniref:Probable nicotinate-nucleotide adenylyltransferase n=1 Tax=Mesotoga infera TaxID=1236046 RepID=A0A7C1GQ21_9BACT|nr:nicotinate (nicotinamide) nucleotide adenylyltransferase [Mesotoga infera]